MAKRTLTNPHGITKAPQTEVTEIYGRRQPKRPHYLREWVERRNYKTDAAFAKEIGADKGVVSRWLDEENPTTPGKDWQEKLGIFFGGEQDPIDIFQHPDEDWFSRMVRANTQDKIEQAKQLLETVGITPDQPKKTAKRS